MSTLIWLTDEDADIAPYKRAKISLAVNKPNRSDAASLVRATTPTVAGPAVVPITRVVGSASFSAGWITDPLGPLVTGVGDWEFHIWALQSALGANVGLNFQVLHFTNQEGPALVNTTSGALPTGIRDVALVSGPATGTTLVEGDRLVIKVGGVDVGGVMAAGNSFTVSYNGLRSRAEGDSYLLCPDNLVVAWSIPADDITAVRQDLQEVDPNPTLPDADLTRWILQAVETYSIDRPNNRAYYYSGDDITQKFPLPPGWVWGFSRVVSAEYPAGFTPPSILDTIDWEVREDALGPQPVRYFWLRNFVPEAGPNNLYITYTTRHEYNSEFSTIPPEDMDAVLWLAASYAARALSARGAGTTDSSIAADVVNYRDMQTRWRSVADAFKRLYEERVITPDSTPVGFTEEWKPIMETGTNFLWHSRRVRRVR